MKKVLMCLVLFSFAAIVFAGTQEGKSSLAGQLFGSGGTEIAYGKMASKKTMYLFSVGLSYSTQTSKTEVGSNSADGPKVSSYSVSLIPEYRNYLRPDAVVSPYWGLYGLVGLGSSKTEPPDNGGTIASSTSTTTNTTFGAGVTLGAEYFLNKTISLSANTRLVQLNFATVKGETGTGETKATNTQNNMSLSLGISAAIYLRIYF
jgi:hypothetical protein